MKKLLYFAQGATISHILRDTRFGLFIANTVIPKLGLGFLITHPYGRVIGATLGLLGLGVSLNTDESSHHLPLISLALGVVSGIILSVSGLPAPVSNIVASGAGIVSNYLMTKYMGAGLLGAGAASVLIKNYSPTGPFAKLAGLLHQSAGLAYAAGAVVLSDIGICPPILHSTFKPHNLNEQEHVPQ